MQILQECAALAAVSAARRRRQMEEPLAAEFWRAHGGVRLMPPSDNAKELYGL